MKNFLTYFVILIVAAGCGETDYYDESNYVEIPDLQKGDYIIQKFYVHQNDTNWLMVKQFYSDKKLRAKHFLFKREKNGPLKAYEENGHIKFEGDFKNDMKDGEFKIYNGEGKLYITEHYKLGKEIGTWTYHDPATGKVVSTEDHNE